MDLLEDLQKMPRVLDADFVIQWLLLRQQLLLLLWEIHHQVLNLSELIHTDKILYLDLFLNINKNLLRILSQRLNDQELKEVLSNIIANRGSVQQLPNHLLSEHEKQVFKPHLKLIKDG